MSLQGIVAYLVQLSDGYVDPHTVLLALRNRVIRTPGISPRAIELVTTLMTEIQPGGHTMDVHEFLADALASPRRRTRSGTHAIDAAALTRPTAPGNTNQRGWGPDLPFVIVWRTPMRETAVSFRTEDGVCGRLAPREASFLAEVVDGDGEAIPASGMQTLKDHTKGRVDQIPWCANRALREDWIIGKRVDGEWWYRLRSPRGHVLEVITIGSLEQIDQRLATLVGPSAVPTSRRRQR